MIKNNRGGREIASWVKFDPRRACKDGRRKLNPKFSSGLCKHTVACMRVSLTQDSRGGGNEAWL